MPELPRLIVGIDLGADRNRVTPGSRRAFETALELARSGGRRVLLLHSTASDEHALEDGKFHFSGEGERPGSRSALEALAREVEAVGVECQIQLSPDPVWLAMSRAAAEAPAALVLLAKRSFSGLDARRLGSEARRVLQVCPGTVWLVAPDGPARPQAILAATDLTEVGLRVLATSAWLSSQAGASLRVVHALTLPLSEQMRDEESWVAERRQQVEEQIRQALASAGGPADAKLHVVLASPTHAILEASQHFDPDVVVLGTLSRRGMAALLIGNTAERVVGSLDASLVAVRPPDFMSPVEAARD